MKPFLLLQLRPEDEAAENEYAAFLKFSGLDSRRLKRARMEISGVPEVELDDYSGIIVGGGPSNVSDNDKNPEEVRFEPELYRLLERVDRYDFPFLGACYGIGLLASYLGGEVSTQKYGEGVGAVDIKLTEEGIKDPLLAGIDSSFRAFGGHKEACQGLPSDATLLASSSTCPIHMIRYKHNIYATQFHPELDADGLALRIKVYKHAGYFDPEEAHKLISNSSKENVEEPVKILHNFVQRYSR